MGGMEIRTCYAYGFSCRFCGLLSSIRSTLGINQAYADEIQLPPKQPYLSAAYQENKACEDGCEAIGSEPPILELDAFISRRALNPVFR